MRDIPEDSDRFRTDLESRVQGPNLLRDIKVRVSSRSRPGGGVEINLGEHVELCAIIKVFNETVKLCQDAINKDQVSVRWFPGNTNTTLRSDLTLDSDTAGAASLGCFPRYCCY